MPEPSFFRIRVVRELKKGYSILPVFYAPDGKTVAQEEATTKNVELVPADKKRRSTREIDILLDTLSDVLCYRGDYADCDRDFDDITGALTEIAQDSRLKYRIGSRVLENSTRNAEHLNYWPNMHWAIEMLGESRCQR